MTLTFKSALLGGALLAISGPAMANILPGSGDTLVGSSIHAGFDPLVAAGNLINGTSNAAYFNSDPRWVFADGSSSEETLIVDLGSSKLVDYAEFAYSGQDRIPTSFEVLTSTNGTTFNIVAGPSPTTAYGISGTYTTAFSFAPSLAQYVEYDFGTDSIGGFGGGGGIGQGGGIIQLDIEAARAVPEPLTLSLVGAGLAGAAALRRRKKKTV